MENCARSRYQGLGAGQQLHSTVSAGCNYLSLPLILACLVVVGILFWHASDVLNLFLWVGDFRTGKARTINEDAELLQNANLSMNVAVDVLTPNNARPGTRLTRNYDVTVQRYRYEVTYKIKISKMHILRCIVSNIVLNFKGALCDILSLSETGLNWHTADYKVRHISY